MLKELKSGRTRNNSLRLLRKKSFNNPIWIIEVSNFQNYQTVKFDSFLKAVKAFNYLSK